MSVCNHFVTLPALQKIFVNIFFVFAWEFCIEKGRGFLVNFCWPPFPGKWSTKTSWKISGKIRSKIREIRDKNSKIRGTFVLPLFWPNILDTSVTGPLQRSTPLPGHPDTLCWLTSSFSGMSVNPYHTPAIHLPEAHPQPPPLPSSPFPSSSRTLPATSNKRCFLKRCFSEWCVHWKGGKDPHPQDFSLTKKTARFTKGQFCPY